MKEFFHDKILSSLTLILIIGSTGCLGYFFYSTFTNKTDYSLYGKPECVQAALTKKMNDEFLTGVINKGDEYTVLDGYFDCNPVDRENLVWFRYSPNYDPVVKIVYGLPGDHFEVINEDKKAGIWTIKINGQKVHFQGVPFYFKQIEEPAIKVYERVRKNKIRDGEYLILSSHPPGDSDSGRFGLVRKRTLRGRVFPNIN